jgi:glycosyltransferase involved in cell wall biosynthesis
MWRDKAMIKLLTFTTLYPNAKRRAHGVFVENRLRHLIASGGAEARVMAPVPYVPALPGLPEQYKVLSDVPPREERHGVEILHPRYFLLPKVSMQVAPFSLYAAAKRSLSRLLAGGYDFDVIDAHYFYPDGVAAILLGRHFGKPVTITARGSDITKLPHYRLPRKMILWAAREAAGIVTVCEALKTALVALGARPEKIRVLRNGVDLAMFSPRDRAQARRCYGFDGTSLLSVGHLIPRKGHDLAIEALAHLPSVSLTIVGDGPEHGNLQRLARRLGVSERVRFLGQIAHEQLAELYSAADLTLLLSTQEGWANVLLESMACGTPVVATDAGGTPEVITTPVVGELVYRRDPRLVAQAIDAVLKRRAMPGEIRAYAEGFSWEATTEGQLHLFDEVLHAREPQPAKRGKARGPARTDIAATIDAKQMDRLPG